MLAQALPVFFLSGIAALLYQVTWQRMLVIFSGADVYSATIVIAAFMGGLGCGSLAAGYLADRLSRFAALLSFAIAEASIAVFGFNSKRLFYDLLYGEYAELAANPFVAGGVLFVCLLVPTSLMGASLPLLARAVTTTIEGAARTVGALYGVNTLGAAIGSLIAIWWLIPTSGIEGTLYAAGWINLACAALVLPAALTVTLRAEREQPASSQPVDGPTSSAWIALYALSGFIALSLEVVWFRLLGVMLKSTSVTFGTLLAQYLFWLGLGAAVGSMCAARVKRPANAFLLLQAAIAAYAGISLTVVAAFSAPDGQWMWPALRDYFDSYDPLGVSRELRQALSSRSFVLLYVVLPSMLLAPATFLMGLSFPMLQRVVQTDIRRIGSRTGLLLLANIAGSTAGTMLTGWVLLRTLGTAQTLMALVALSLVFVIAAWRRSSDARAKWAVAVAGVLLAATMFAIPAKQRLWAALHGTAPERALVAEDGSGVSLLKSASPTFASGVVVFVNGLGQSHLPYGGIHTELGALPALFHPAPHNAALIGLGSGDTLFGAAGRPELQRIVSIEIVKPQIDTLQALFRRHQYGGLSTVLGDPRIEHVFGDGRLVLKIGGEKFDIIEADALRPDSAYAGNLYSEEYFKLLRDQLKPGGWAVTWAPTSRVTRTFVKVFPHVVGFGSILVGSDRIIPLDRKAIESRLANPRIIDYYARAGIDIRRSLVPLLNATRVFRRDDPDLEGDINTDLFPRDEFAR